MASKAAQVDFLIAGMLKADATINSAGVVEFFQAQSGSWATPKNAFEEAAKSTPITTLTLDAAGKGTAFCDGVYDIRIKDSDGSTVDSLLEVNFSRPDTSTGAFNIEVITGSSNVALDGDEDIVIVNTTSNISVTLASSATADGRKIIVKAINAATGTITVKATSPDTIDGVAGATGVAITAQYESLELVADSANAVYHRATRGTILADTISESTAATGVTADGVLMKDSKVTASGGVDAGTSPGVITDIIAEKTSDTGVTADSVLMKDGVVIPPSGVQSDTVVGTPETYTADTIAFVDSDPDTITDSANGFGSYIGGQTITISGSTSNDGTYTIATAAVGTLTLIAGDTLAVEAASASVTVSGATIVTIGGMGIRNGGPSPTSWPSFSVHKNGANQASVGTALEIITWPTEVFDTNSDFAANRFTPTVAGKYLLVAQIQFDVDAADDALNVSIYKNGATAKEHLTFSHSIATQPTSVTAILDANGSTDYFEVFAANGTTADTVLGLATLTYFMGSRIA